MSDDPRTAIEWKKDQLRQLPEAEIQRIRDRSAPTTLDHKAAHELTVELAEKRHRELVPKPEWKTWSFWMALAGILIGTLALLRDCHDWRAQDPGSHGQGSLTQESGNTPPEGSHSASAS